MDCSVTASLRSLFRLGGFGLVENGFPFRFGAVLGRDLAGR